VEWKAILILDAPQDNSAKIAFELIRGLPVTIVINDKRKGLGYNLWYGIKHCGAEDEDVVCILDADDWLDKKAFAIVKKMYERTNCLVTYGSYIKLSKGRKTKVSRPYNSHDSVRTGKWHGSHLKTFKYKLWKHFPKEYLQYKGEWAEAASDRGLMYGIMEIAGLKNCRHIKEPIYYWRDNTPSKTNVRLQKKWDDIFRKMTVLKERY